MRRFWQISGLAALPLMVAALPAHTLEPVEFVVSGAPEALAESIRSTSLTQSAYTDNRRDAQEIFAAARSDYARILGTLYAEGYYSGTINILIDGREASGIAPLNAPKAINKISIRVTPGPAFTFGAAEVAPLRPGTELPEGFATGEPARSGVIRQAAEAAIDHWRDGGHAKARIADEAVTANHKDRLINARIRLDQGPVVTFGKLTFRGRTAMREGRLYKIAGLTEGERYSPEELAKAADRLRRTGVFRSVSLVEADTLGPGNTLDITATVSDMPRRRLGFGAELTSTEGAALTAFWMHRNLLGGAERLRIDGEISRIGAKDAGPDYKLGLSLERPASFTPDTTARLTLGIERVQDSDARIDNFTGGFGLSHIFSSSLTGRADLNYGYTRTVDSLGERRYRNISLPVGLTWDRRDNAFDPKKGFWIDATAMPFAGLGATDSGLRAKIDARGYRAIGERVVLAARLQGGIIAGADLLDTPSDYLFWSGGGGTVRGHEFRSLGVDLGSGVESGGTRFAAASLELRTRVTEKIGVVAFADYGHVSDKAFSAAPLDDWHGGAGLGLRYATPVGPLRLDIAAPVGGRKAKGAQFYLGIGQAF
ncbi:autotransporter assembly complex family protein [Falsigemmobacter intermedius]|uniref:autotransporter assembly complex protein TamA n=1 Tax=Falsigemmobacter intermedius TaxID=1553448 RepID=UPI001F4F8753|nr:autotransporter assembly complex family protein [Falsigemmobacter intermedius]